eukprot:gene10148-12872_t
MGYDDQVKTNNLSGGVMSDFEFVQSVPKRLRELITDDDQFERLSTKREKEIQKMGRNVDLFIRHMGWTEGPPTKKRAAPASKDSLAITLGASLDKAISAKASVDDESIFSDLTDLTGATSLGAAMAKTCLNSE